MPSKLPPPPPGHCTLNNEVVRLLERRALGFTAFCLWLVLVDLADKDTLVVYGFRSFRDSHPTFFTGDDGASLMTDSDLESALNELVANNIISVVGEDAYELSRDYARLS